MTALTQEMVQIGKTLNLPPQDRRLDGTFYAGNKEYRYQILRYIDAPQRIHNPEGYVSFDPQNGQDMQAGWSDDWYNYYRRDHLGNNREVWRAPYKKRLPLHDDFGNISWIDVQQPATTIQRTQYYPSGLPWAQGTGAGEQPYKYNGKEFIEMHGLDEYDSKARRLYSAIMRTTTPDPYSEKYPWISHYAWCANNPVRFIDPTGMEFTDAAWRQVNRLIADINRRQAQNTEDIAKKQAQIDAGGLSDKKVASLQKDINKLSNNSSELEGVRGEIAVLAGSTQMYDIKEDNSLNIRGAIPGLGETRSSVNFNFKNGNVELRLGDNSLGTLAHELKHAHQFETGALSIGMRMDGKGVPFHDKTDEWAAYSRGALFGGERIYSLPSVYNDLQDGPMDATKLAPIILTPSGLQGLANHTQSVFRVNGVTYRMRGK